MVNFGLRAFARIKHFRLSWPRRRRAAAAKRREMGESAPEGCESPGVGAGVGPRPQVETKIGSDRRDFGVARRSQEP